MRRMFFCFGARHWLAAAISATIALMSDVSAASENSGGGRAAVELRGPWWFRQAGDEKPGAWMPASVPGCVHTDLLRNRRIADPFVGTNEKDQQWIEKLDWEYKTVLAADDALLARERIELHWTGLDTYAEVTLNGTPVLWADNMFRQWRVDIKPQLRRGDNLLVVRFRSPITFVKPAYDRMGYVLPAVNDQAKEMVSMYTRKAPYHYGWDWGPRFVTSGIWRPVFVESWDGARIDDVQVIQRELGETQAKLQVVVTVQAARAVRGKVTASVEGGGQAEQDVALGAGPNRVTLAMTIANPRRWWPNGLGAAFLYSVRATLAIDGQPADERRTKIGLRTLEVEHRRDKDGKSFVIKVNGAPVFMKGANYIPSDSFLNRVTPERTRALVQAAADANMNMLRVWGGGVYEDDHFYELCDQLGILVWQDFMFACSMYPGDAAFIENVRQEAIQNVRRLRNHPSLALWAGNNEIEAAWAGWGWQWKFALGKAAQEKIWNDYKHLFHQVLPAVVAQEDPGRFYTRSSPSANEDGVPANKKGLGDMHYWGVWHSEEPYTKYADNTSRFMSEYGFQSFPELATVAQYASPADLRIDSPVMLAHQRHPRGNQLVRAYMDRDFRAPKDFASFLYVSQVLQATVIKYGAEAHRRRMPYNMGSLYWQLDDCWPVASWSGIDYFGRWKALHHFARHFFAPVLVSPVEEGGMVRIFGVSDLREDKPARLLTRLVDFDGHERWRKESDVMLPGNSSHVVQSISKRDALKGADPTQVVLVTELWSGGQRMSRNNLYFVKTRELVLPAPGLALSAELHEGGATVRVTAGKLARNVWLSTTAGPGEAPLEGMFSDNFFDVLPGESVTVTWTPKTGGAAVDASRLRAALRALTIRDTY